MSSSTTYAKKFSSQECLEAKFSTEIINQGKFFGLLKNKLNIEKERCLLTIKFKSILEKTWVIDLCREPVHMKVTDKGSQNVYKREKSCDNGEVNDFCYFWNELRDNLQDNGLIFAEGEREKLSDAHGQTYCSSLLLEKYLGEGNLFSQYDKGGDIYPQTPTNNEIVSPVEEVKEVEIEMIEDDTDISLIDNTSASTSQGEAAPITEEIKQSVQENKPRF